MYTYIHIFIYIYIYIYIYTHIHIYVLNISYNMIHDKTYRYFKVRVSEHQGVSPRTGNSVKGTLSTSVRDRMLVCDHKVVHEDFKCLGNESSRYLLELKESLFIKRDMPSLNKNLYSQELLLF